MANVKLVVAVEEPTLREDLLDVLRRAGADPGVLSPEQLLAAIPEQDTFVVLNTGTEMERLVATAAALYEKWSACGMGLCIRTYSLPELTPEAVVFRLWSIAPELNVMVGLTAPRTAGASNRPE